MTEPGMERLTPTMLSTHGRLSATEVERFQKRVRHVGPQVLVAGVSLDEAIDIKEEMEFVGFGVAVQEQRAAASRESQHARAAIPEAVRHEVWRRDGGQCMDCGSRERLEFDHI